MSSRGPDRAGMSPARVMTLGVGVLLLLLLIGGLLVAGSFTHIGVGRAAPQPGLPASSTVDAAAGNPSALPAPRKDQATAPGLTRLLREYLLRAADQPVAGYALLTSRYRKGSGGFATYRSFWGDITFATPSRIVAQPRAGTVTYDVRYRHRDGSHTYDRATLTVSVENGRYLVDGEH